MRINCALLESTIPYHFGTIFMRMIRSGRKAFPEKFTSPRATLVKQRASGEYRRFLLVRREPIFRNTRTVSNSLSPIESPRFRDRILRFPIAAENRENAGDPRGRCIARERETLVSHVSTMLPLRFPFFPFSFLFFFFLSSLVWRVRTHTEMDNFHCSSASVKRANKLESFTWYYEGTKALFVSRPDAIADRITS